MHVSQQLEANVCKKLYLTKSLLPEAYLILSLTNLLKIQRDYSLVLLHFRVNL